MTQELRCDHCERTVANKAYRVISEDTEGGGILLDMIVCDPCSEKAQELGLKIEEIDVNDRYLKRG
jgi:pimeloyl-CoA synthetase